MIFVCSLICHLLRTKNISFKLYYFASVLCCCLQTELETYNAKRYSLKWINYIQNQAQDKWCILRSCLLFVGVFLAKAYRPIVLFIYQDNYVFSSFLIYKSLNDVKIKCILCQSYWYCFPTENLRLSDINILK